MFVFFFFNDTATTEIYTLSLHDALPIWEPCARSTTPPSCCRSPTPAPLPNPPRTARRSPRGDRKSTRLNSSHANISYAVFCLKKKKKPIKSLHSNLTYHISSLNEHT